MAHYAFLDENNIVTQVITGRDEDEVVEGITDWEQFYSQEVGQTCKRTSYRTYGNNHPNGTSFRGNYAGIGYTYDPVNDVFYQPQPFPSWTLNQETWLWEPPTPQPLDAPNIWDEQLQSWVYI